MPLLYAIPVLKSRKNERIFTIFTMWYQNAWRRHLCDMHVDDWDPSFLAKFDPDVYVDNLKRASIQSAMLYFQSHVGLCYFPTRVGKIHNGFVGREDLMRQLVARCKAEGIAVTGYYSLIYNTLEHDRHPDWRMVDAEGCSRRERLSMGGELEFTDNQKAPRYGFCCPNNRDYRAFVKAQIEEMAAYFPHVDGMFYDMLFWPHVCYCESCRARWEQEVGGDIPIREDWSDPLWLLHMQKRREWMGEFAGWVTDLTKALLPDVSVEHNVAYSALPNGTTANCEEVIAACDYAGGDLYRGVYTQSFACKFYRSITKNPPFEYMFSRCAPKLSAHTQIKSPDIMKSAVGITAAHHGATLVIDAIDPVGTMDARVYDRIGEAFAETKPLEAYFVGRPIADIGLYYSLKSKFNPRGEAYTNYLGTVNTAETLIQKHLLFDVTGGFSELAPYQAILFSCPTEEDAYDIPRLLSYVENGGTLYFSGGDCPSLLKALFGATVTGRTAENAVYLSPRPRAQAVFGHYNEDYPFPFDGSAPIAEGFDPRDILATLTLPYTRQGIREFASIHSNPPGIRTSIPAIVAKAYGKGAVIWSALPIECAALYDNGDLLIDLLTTLTPLAPTLTATAPDDVEITAYQADRSILLHAVQINDRPRARKIADFDVTVSIRSPIKAVLSIPDHTPAPFKTENNAVTIRVTSPRILNTYEIQF